MAKNLKAMGTAAFMTASALIGAPTTMNFEGLRLKPYYDSVGIKTWCAGETEVGYKEEFTKSECELMYNIRYGYYSMRVMMMYNDVAQQLVTPEIHASITDMAYNVGVGTVEKSSMIRHINAGKPTQACDAILLYKKAGGYDCSIPGNKVCYGVWDRRVRVNKLCKGQTA